MISLLELRANSQHASVCARRLGKDWRLLLGHRGELSPQIGRAPLATAAASDSLLLAMALLHVARRLGETLKDRL